MTSTHLFTEEPPDGTILANDDLSEVVVRNDKANPPPWRWYQVNLDCTPMAWHELAGGQRQRLYRQSDVDALTAEVARLREDNETLKVTLALTEQERLNFRLELERMRAKLAELSKEG